MNQTLDGRGLASGDSGRGAASLSEALNRSELLPSIAFTSWAVLLIALNAKLDEGGDRAVSVAAFVSLVAVFQRADARSVIDRSPWAGFAFASGMAAVAATIMWVIPTSRTDADSPWAVVLVTLYGLIAVGTVVGLWRSLKPGYSHQLLRPMIQPYGIASVLATVVEGLFAAVASRPQRWLDRPLIVTSMVLVAISVISSSVIGVVLWQLGRRADLMCLLGGSLNAALVALWLGNPNRAEDQLVAWISWMLLGIGATLASAGQLGSSYDHRPIVSTAGERHAAVALGAITAAGVILAIGTSGVIEVAILCAAMALVVQALLHMGRSDGAPLAGRSRRDRLARDLSASLVHDQVGLRFRAIRGLNDGEVLAVAAYPVWTHRVHGHIGGDELDAVVDRAELRTQFDVRLLERAVPTLASVLALVPGDPWVLIPVSATTLSDPSFEHDLVRMLTWWGGDLHGLVFSLDRVPDQVGLRGIARLRGAGLWVAMEAARLDDAVAAGLDLDFVLCDIAKLATLRRDATTQADTRVAAGFDPTVQNPAGAKLIVTQMATQLHGPQLRPGHALLDPWETDPDLTPANNQAARRQAALISYAKGLGADFIADGGHNGTAGSSDPLSVILASVYDPYPGAQQVTALGA